MSDRNLIDIILDYKRQFDEHENLIKMDQITVYILYSALALLTFIVLGKSARNKIYGLTFVLVVLLLVDIGLMICTNISFKKMDNLIK